MLLKLTLFLLSLAISLATFAQYSDIKINPEPVTIGFNQQDQASIKAHSIGFSHPIYFVELADTSGVIAAGVRRKSSVGKFKKKGVLTFVDVESREILHRRPINYETTKIRSYNGLFLESTKHETVRLNPRTEEKIWEINSDIPIVIRNRNIGIGYGWKGNNYRSSQLQAFNLEDGSVMWSTDVPHDYGWSDFKVINDSLLVVAADGLFGININTGQKWHFEARTGYMFWDAPAQAASSTFVPPSQGRLEYGKNRFAKMVASNIVADSTGIFFASANNITKLNFNGEVAWQQQLPEELTGRMQIKLHNDRIVLLNYGYAYKVSVSPALGIPFFSAYARDTGEEMHLHQLRDTKSNEHIYFLLTDSYLQVLQTSFIRGFDLITGELTSSSILPSSEEYFSKYFTESNLYIQKTKNLFSKAPYTNDSIVSISSNSYFLYENDVNILTLSTSNHQIIELHEGASLYRSIGKNGQYNFLVDGRHQSSSIIDSSGKSISDVFATLTNFSRFSKKEIAFKGRELYIIERGSLLPEKGTFQD